MVNGHKHQAMAIHSCLFVFHGWVYVVVVCGFFPCLGCSLVPAGNQTLYKGMWEGFQKVKQNRLVGWDKDNLISKAKVAHTSKIKQGIHSPLPTGRQVCSSLKESRALSCMVVTWKDKGHHSECSLPSLSFPQLRMLYGMQYPWGHLGSAVLVSPPSFSGGVLWGAEMALALCKLCSAVTKTSLYYQHCFQNKSKTQSHTCYYEEN